MRNIKLIIDDGVIKEYEQYYFLLHPKARKSPIPHPYHESINQWMIMRRPMMNSIKQKWKDFIVWFVQKQGYSNLRIKECEITQKVYYPNNRRHDIDNSVPKFILDGLVESGMIEDDDSRHLILLTLMCFTDVSRPRTELYVKIKKEKESK